MNATIGEKFNWLTLLEMPRLIRKGKAKRYRAQFKCDCGCVCDKDYFEVKHGHTKSCGCAQRDFAKAQGKRNTIHGLSRAPLMAVWRGMKVRCYNSRRKDYIRYGARGISVCAEWLESSKAFFDWALSHGYKCGLQLDRINTDGNYCPENCRFVSVKENSNNKSDNVIVVFNGEKLPLVVAHQNSKTDIPYEVIRKRIYRYGMTFEQAIAKEYRSMKRSIAK